MKQVGKGRRHQTVDHIQIVKQVMVIALIDMCGQIGFAKRGKLSADIIYALHIAVGIRGAVENVTDAL